MNVFIYVLDSLRADHVSSYGYPRETTPNIDALATDGYRFENAYTTSTWTKEAATSLLSGLYPSAAGVNTVYDSLSADVTTVADVLKQEDFGTAAATATGHVSPEYGFDSGFDDFRVISNRNETAKAALGDAFGRDIFEEHNFVPPRATVLQDYVLDAHREHDGDNFFGLMWSLDTHDPFFVTDSDATFTETGQFAGSIQNASIDRIVDIYDDMIRVNDRRLGQFVETLKRRGIYDDSLLFVLGDHGEAFGEHGTRGHAGPPYSEQIDVPFILKPPAGDERTYETTRPVQLTDVLPTVLDRLGVPVPEYIQGEVLGSNRRRTATDPRLVYTETQYDYSRNRLESIQRGGEKLISQTPTEVRPFLTLLYQMLTNAQLKERLRSMNHSYDIVTTVKSQTAYRLGRPQSEQRLYDLNDDPEEEHDLSESSGAGPTLAEFRHLLETVEDENQRRRENIDVHSFTTIDPDTRKQLEDIGYKM